MKKINIDPDKVIKTEPKMVKEGIGVPSLIFVVLFIIILIGILISQ